MLDSEQVYTSVTNEVLAPYGKSLSWELKASLMGRPAHDATARQAHPLTLRRHPGLTAVALFAG